MKRTAKGFTLIELLVVIAIIAMLASVILASLSSARFKAADARRKVDLRQLQTALELYYNDNNAYPSTGGNWYGNTPNGGNRSAWIPGLAPTYIATLPQDPYYTPTACGTWGGAYLYRSDGKDYKILNMCPQNSSVSQTAPGEPFYDPFRPGAAWQVTDDQSVTQNW